MKHLKESEAKFIRQVKLKKPSSYTFINVYNIYKDRPCYAHCYYTTGEDGKDYIAIGDKNRHMWWYPADLIDYISGRLIRCDIKIV